MRGSSRAVAALLLGLIVACGGTGAPPGPPTPTPVSDDGSRLADAANSAGRLVGAAVNHGPLASEPAYGETLSRHFNYVTAEYEMKWDPIQAAGPDRYDYSGGDAVVDFALAHGMKVKGHALVWHGAVPAWAEGVAAAAFGPMIDDYIANVVGHYRGKVIAWDVVNEAEADDGSGLRDSIFLRKLGSGFIERAFRDAHAADPDAILFYNDYGAEGSGKKSDRVYELVRDLKERGVPIDGVGLQMHIAATQYPSAGDIIGNMQRLAALGLRVNVSELDVRIRDVVGTPAQKLDRQRQVYADVVGACMAVPQCHAVTLWGFTDKYSWIDSSFGADDPLIFDESYRKKPAYYGMQDAFFGR
jgi:endo-1,4-beta-xylanase